MSTETRDEYEGPVVHWSEQQDSFRYAVLTQAGPREVTGMPKAQALARAEIAAGRAATITRLVDQEPIPVSHPTMDGRAGGG